MLPDTTTSSHRVRWSAMIAMTCLVPIASRTLGGNGTFVSSGGNAGVFNFCVSVRFNATETQLARIRDRFARGSEIVADATDGQHRFGEVTLVNDSGASKSAEYWVHPGDGRADANSHYGVRGEHVNLYYNTYFATDDVNKGAYTIAHEHAHHVYGVKDEYAGPSGQVSCFENSTPTLSYSLMDNFFDYGGNAPPAPPFSNYTLNEFCIHDNHDPNEDTYQEAILHQSCWETIASSRFPATPPIGLPIDSPPPPQSVAFHEGLAGLRVMLVIDRSGSMASDNKLVFAKLGAITFARQLDNGDVIGMASFATDATVNVPLVAIAAGVVDQLTVAINALMASGSTNIGGGLQLAVDQITSQTEHSCNDIIVLLSDGDHNVGTTPAAVLPAIIAEHITVFSIGVGSGISTSGQATLQNLATATGGRYFSVANAGHLILLFIQLAMESMGNGLLNAAPIQIATGQTLSVPIMIEQEAGGALFAVTLQDQNDEVSVALQSPDGTIITAKARSPKVIFAADPNSQIFKVFNPQAGVWQMIITARSITTGSLGTAVFVDHDGTEVTSFIQDDTIVYPQPTLITATLRYEGEVVVGADVQAIVTRPNGTQVEVTFQDDGNISAHGDDLADDGIYSTRFTNYQGDGTYTFQITGINEDGATFPGESLFSQVPPNTRPVPPFIRVGNVTAVVTGVPVIVDGDGDGVPDVEDDCPASILAGTVVIDGCNTFVPNHLFSNGCTMSDQIAQCAQSAQHHGEFVCCVILLAVEWWDQEVISGGQFAHILIAALLADIP